MSRSSSTTGVERPKWEVRLEKSSPIPLYFQIARRIEEAIDGGVLVQGELLESELDLAARLGVSRPTVRQAIDRLVDQGLAARRRGIGTVVVPRRVRRPMELTSLYDDLSAAGRSPSSTILALETAPAGSGPARALGVDEGTPVLYIERLRYADGEPLGIMHNYLPTDLLEVTKETLEHEGLYALLRSRGVRPHAAEQTIGARVANATEARMLAGPRSLTVLATSRTTFDAYGHPIEYADHCYRADRYSFVVTLMAHNEIT